MLTPVIIAGGTGTRLWPLSRKQHPKQFLNFGDNGSLLQATLNRLKPLHCSTPIIVCHKNHRFIISEQLLQNNSKCYLLLESESINTAAAIASAAFQSLSNDEIVEPVFLILPSDHLVQQYEKFFSSIIRGLGAVEEGRIVVFGVVPSSPETGYGYIKFKEASDDRVEYSKQPYFSVIDFVEKPKLDVAKAYIENGNYLWNSGMFMAKASVFLELFEDYQNEIYQSCKAAVEKSVVDLDFIRLDSDAYKHCPSISFDHGIMEPLCKDKNRKIEPVVIPLDCGWSDLGSWDAVHELNKTASDQNAILGDAILQDSTNCLVKSDNRLVTLLGVKDIAVIDTKDALLVANLNRVQEVKDLVTVAIPATTTQCSALY